jgi:beta-lactamase superfamily II metal-dependent hydrolase
MNGKKKASASLNLKTYLFNVGQGDHLLLELPNGEFGVIDFYYEGPHLEEPPALTYLKYLKHLGKEIVISFICVTHPDNDHIKGIGEFLGWILDNNIKVRHLWLFAGNDFDELVAHFKDAFEQIKNKTEKAFQKADAFTSRLQTLDNFIQGWKGTPVYIQGVSLISDQVGGEIEVISIAPLGNHIQTFNHQAREDLFRLILKGRRKSTAQRNLVSSVLLMKFRKHKLLFGGDTGKKIWQECLENYKNSGNEKKHGKCEGNFIKISHHGSKYSSSDKLWKQILSQKSYLGISAGKGRYKHPHRETVVNILRIAQQNSYKAEVSTTNACSKCLHHPKLKNEHIEGFEAVSDSLKPEVKESLRNIKSPKYKEKPSPPYFLTYVFSFSGKDNDIQISNGVSRSKSLKTYCLYGNNLSHKYFPECALNVP